MSDTTTTGNTPELSRDRFRSPRRLAALPAATAGELELGTLAASDAEVPAGPTVLLCGHGDRAAATGRDMVAGR